MFDETDKESVVGDVVYAFATADSAKSFEACLETDTLASCKETWAPVGIYPPTKLDLDID